MDFWGRESFQKRQASSNVSSPRFGEEFKSRGVSRKSQICILRVLNWKNVTTSYDFRLSLQCFVIFRTHLMFKYFLVIRTIWSLLQTSRMLSLERELREKFWASRTFWKAPYLSPKFGLLKKSFRQSFRAFHPKM